MKKLIAIFLLLAMSIMLYACSSDVEKGTDNSEASDTKVTEIADTTAPAKSDGETDAADTPELPVQNETLPISDGTQLIFSSGAGGWATVIHLNSDGSFEGAYHDSEMGEVGEGYSYGTIYLSSFEGKFTNIKKTGDYSYSMTLESVETEKAAGEEWIEGQQRYVAADPHGITGTEFVFYLPETPASETDSEFLTWWPYRYENLDEDGELTDPNVTLGCYALHNLTDNFGFFSY